MPTETLDPIDAHLNEVAVHQFTWKNDAIRNAAVRIVRKALEADVGEFFPDDVDMDGFDATIPDPSPNCVGSAYRILMNAEIIKRTGRYRRSEAKKSNGRTVFGLMLANAAFARTFMKRNVETLVPVNPQQEFTILR